MSIEVCNLSKQFGTFAALRDVSLEVRSGELLALLGPSGSGKTTLLRVIAGLDVGDSGQVLFQGEDATDQHVRERQVGFVFQHYALFRNMTIFENVAFGLRVRPKDVRPPDAEIRDRVHELLKLVQLDWLAERYPHQLSGGQRQRIALARALAVEPKVLLLDEPFGALDAKVRKELRSWLRRLHDDMHITSVFVTHDQEEALEVADRVVVMNEGRIEQIGTPDEVYENPASPFVYEFLGNVNLFHSRLHRGRAWIDGIEVDAPEHAEAEELAAVAYVRPHDIEVDRTAQGDAALAARVTHVLSVGPIVRLELVRDDSEDKNPIQVEISKERFRELQLVRGDQVFIKPRRFDLFPRRIH
ncbi:MAG: sulfate ABC transporter ATP-binding protein [Nitrosomonadaceae bacterium]|nr:sulfate ABC transporter ATP-binding protein [Nitrosospira sp.]MDW7564730.1 sulfate ABC transporter ATP-binding protein [Nitrosomonadaceae bacterium]MBI0409086.1 sulfate ABC transporter ATP-binding protein [Nitrosospira sp.]MBI0409748.1 sulfate ABC transporter ATP-binding protein [Nitrosospira sp.]MBI0411748.1 sulfate ABC transporter ATP-binding protein [Nitrosospira sp.]